MAAADRRRARGLNAPHAQQGGTPRAGDSVPAARDILRGWCNPQIVLVYKHVFDEHVFDASAAQRRASRGSVFPTGSE